MDKENGFIWKVLVVIHHVLKTLRLCPHAETTIFRNQKINIAHQAGMKSLENKISLILLFFWQKKCLAVWLELSFKCENILLNVKKKNSSNKDTH